MPASLNPISEVGFTSSVSSVTSVLSVVNCTLFPAVSYLLFSGLVTTITKK